MEPKQSARELLREARAELAKAHDHLMELTAKLPMQYFGLVDGNIIQAEGCFVDKIDAYLATPAPDARELACTIEKIFDDAICDVDDYHGNYVPVMARARAEAAALIEQRSRRVPRAMLREVYNLSSIEWERSADAIAAKYGVKVDGR